MKEFYWAVVHYQKWWMFFDQAQLRLIDADGLTAGHLRRVAANYRVARGMGLEQSDDVPLTAAQREHEMARRADGLAKLISARASSWPPGLPERESFCRDLLEGAKKEKLVRGNQISAITKLMWFLRPEGWTMFDQLAAAGRSVSVGAKPTRSAEFYRRLHERGFDECVRKIAGALRGSVLAAMPASRVIDSFLVIRGANDQDVEYARLKAHLAGLPKLWREGLTDAAQRVQGAMQPFAQSFDK